MKIIYLTGVSTSGKDQFARYLKAVTKFKDYTFGDQVKYQLARLLGIDASLLFSNKKDSSVKIDGLDFKLRDGMRDISWVFKNQHPEYYAKIVADNIQPGQNVIITDLRFIVEKEHLDARFPGAEVIVINIQRQGLVKQDVVSEMEHYDIAADWIVDNNGTLKDLKDAAIQFAMDNEIYKPRSRKRRNYGSKKETSQRQERGRDSKSRGSSRSIKSHNR